MINPELRCLSTVNLDLTDTLFVFRILIGREEVFFMKQKYEKPTIRDLGDVLPTAKGDCDAGNIANGSGYDCKTFGSVASGVNCINTGLTAVGGDCNPGTVASVNCNNGGNTN
jgi:hypothetical protein